MPTAASPWLELPSGKAVPIAAGSCSIGRALSNHLVLHDDKVSRHHALIQVLENHECWLVDLGSANGTYINGRRIEQAVLLRELDEITVGHEHIIFRSSTTGSTASDDFASLDQTALEVRQLTLWFLLVDIVDSTGISHRLGPQVMATKFSEWSARCRKILDDSGGIIDKPLGDGFFAFWPTTAERPSGNVAAALRLFSELQRSADLPFRMALHQGTAFTGGQMASGTYRLFGSEVNFTFRMEGLAKALQIDCLLSEAARTGLGQHVAATPAGVHSVTGLEGSFAFFRL